MLLILNDLNKAVNSENAVLAVNQEVPTALLRLMKCPGLKRDPYFYNLLQRAEERAPHSSDQCGSTLTDEKIVRDRAPSWENLSTAVPALRVSINELDSFSELHSLPPLSSCHSSIARRNEDGQSRFTQCEIEMAFRMADQDVLKRNSSHT